MGTSGPLRLSHDSAAQGMHATACAAFHHRQNEACLALRLALRHLIACLWVAAFLSRAALVAWHDCHSARLTAESAEVAALQ